MVRPNGFAAPSQPENDLGMMAQLLLSQLSKVPSKMHKVLSVVILDSVN